MRDDLTIDNQSSENDNIPSVNLSNDNPSDPNLSLEYAAVPQNPYVQDGKDYQPLIESTAPENPTLDIPYNPPRTQSWWGTVGSEASEFSGVISGIHGTYDYFTEPNSASDIPPTGWTPKSDPSMLLNVRAQYANYIMEGTGPRDQLWRRQRVLAQQDHDDNIENGDFSAKILGGAIGLGTDFGAAAVASALPGMQWLAGLIPEMRVAKYGNIGRAAIKNFQRALPGAAAWSATYNAGQQIDNVNGNLHDFMTNTFVDTVFASTLFGLGGLGAHAIEKMNLWNTRRLANAYSDGVNFDLKLNENGEFTGIQASASNDTVSAARVASAQNMADTAFHQGGFFKIPYLGSGAMHLMTNSWISKWVSSPLMQFIGSPYNTMRNVIDRVSNHTFITDKLMAGKTAPQKFETLMNQDKQSILTLQADLNYYHLKANGADVEFRPAQSLISNSKAFKSWTLQKLGKQLSTDDYLSKDDFYDRVDNVLRNNVKDDNQAINDAAESVKTLRDTTYGNWRKAYNLPENWHSPLGAEGYSSRVYDTDYMSANFNQWQSAIGGYLKKGDDAINFHMQPIKDVDNKISTLQQQHDDLVSQNGDINKIKNVREKITTLKNKKVSMENNLSNKIRSDKELIYHADDHTAFSHDESQDLEKLLEPHSTATKKLNEQKKLVSSLKTKISSSESSLKKANTAETLKKHKELLKDLNKKLTTENSKLDELSDNVSNEYSKLVDKVNNNEIDGRYYTRDSKTGQVNFKDPNNKLKFRKTYYERSKDEGIDAQKLRETDSKSTYNKIMNQTASQTTAEIMGRLTGSNIENHIKERSLLVPDEIIKPFLTKDLMAKTANYVNYFGRRTHLKTVFADITHGEGWEGIGRELNEEHQTLLDELNSNKEAIVNKLSDIEKRLKEESLSDDDRKNILKERRDLNKQLDKAEKSLENEHFQFGKATENLEKLFDRMMGHTDKPYAVSRTAIRGLMAYTAFTNLGFLPISMITDLSVISFATGMYPFIRDGVYPIINNLFTGLHGEDGEALRRAAPSLQLAVNDVSLGISEHRWQENWGNKYLNMGKRVLNSFGHIAHVNANFTLVSYIDNMLQRVAASVYQSEFMRISHAYVKGNMTDKEGMFMRKYGIDPAIWSKQFVEQFKKNGGRKTAIGGYQSMFWNWEDAEIANKFGDAVFKGVKAAHIQKGLSDSPFWADRGMGIIIHGFSGWSFAAMNRLVIPSLQAPDANTVMATVFSLGLGALVSPLRRLAHDDNPFPANQTTMQRSFEIMQDSGSLSAFANVLWTANLLTGGKWLGQIGSDRFRQRQAIGLSTLGGPSVGSLNTTAGIASMALHQAWNKNDFESLGRQTPFLNSPWMYWMYKNFIESTHLPQTRAQADAIKAAGI